MVHIATPDDFDNDQNLEDLDPEDIVLGELDRIEINGKTAELPDQPLLDFTRERVEGDENRDGLRESLGVNPDYSKHQMEDMTFVLENMDGRDIDTITPVIEQDFEDGEIFDTIEEELQNAFNPENILFGRYVTFLKNTDLIDTDTEVKLAKTVASAGLDVYVALPITLQEEKTFQTTLAEYIDRMKTLNEKTEEQLKIVPVLHLVGLDHTAGNMFANAVENNLSKESFPFVGVTGSPLYTNAEPFRGVRDSSDRKLLVSNCPKKVNHSRYPDIGKMGLQELYRIRGADVVLQERSIIGGGEADNKIELPSKDDYHFHDPPVRNAESPISEQVDIESNRRTLLDDNKVKVHASAFISEMVARNRAESLRERLREDVEEVYNDRPYVENALAELLNPQ